LAQQERERGGTWDVRAKKVRKVRLDRQVKKVSLGSQLQVALVAWDKQAPLANPLLDREVQQGREDHRVRPASLASVASQEKSQGTVRGAPWVCPVWLENLA